MKCWLELKMSCDLLASTLSILKSFNIFGGAARHKNVMDSCGLGRTGKHTIVHTFTYRHYIHTSRTYGIHEELEEIEVEDDFSKDADSQQEKVLLEAAKKRKAES